MEHHNYHVNMGEVIRNILFPYPVNCIGRSWNNPPRNFLHSVFPDKIEICIRLSADTAGGLPTQTIGGETYENLPYPHVVVKPPRTEYTLSNFGGARDVFYMIYPSSLYPLLEKTGIFQQPLCWDIRRNQEIELMIKRICDYFDSSLSLGNADRIDIHCFQLLCELLLMKKSSAGAPDKEYELMLRIDSYLRLHAFEVIDFDDVAKMFGLSRSSFFRYWKRYSKIAPAKYLQELRLQEACRRLSESRDKITEIARELNLGESAYMGVLFRARFGQTPLEYRRTHSLHLNE